MIKLLFRNWGREKIDLSMFPHTEIASVSANFKEDGALGDKPSLAFVCTDKRTGFFVHQMSMETLTHVLEQAGYKVTRKSPESSCE